MIVSTIDIYQDTTTRDKLIFPSAISRILTHVHVIIPFSSPFYAMGTISKESIKWSNAQLVAKWPCVKDDATSNPRPSLSSTSSSSSRVKASLATIMD